MKSVYRNTFSGPVVDLLQLDTDLLDDEEDDQLSDMVRKNGGGVFYALFTILYN